MKSNFDFLQTEWPAFYAAAKKAEGYVHGDARAACFYTRRALEITVSWLYQNDAALKLPYLDNLSALIHEPTFKTTVGSAVFNKAVLITRLGNQAVHSQRIVTQFDALSGVKELFHLSFWLARTYARGAKPVDGLVFDQELLPKTSSGLPQTQDQLKKLADELAGKGHQTFGALRRQGSAQRPVGAGAQGNRGDQKEERGDAGHPRLLGGGDARLLH